MYKINKAISDPLAKEVINLSEKADDPLKMDKENRSNMKESSESFKRSRKCGYSRWGRKEDTQMFLLLAQLWKQENVDAEDFWTDHAKISIQHDYILMNLAFQMNWRGNNQSLLKRIQGLGRDQTLSTRQMNLLRKLKNKANRENKEFSLRDVVDSFPGKSISTLQSALDNIQGSCKH